MNSIVCSSFHVTAFQATGVITKDNYSTVISGVVFQFANSSKRRTSKAKFVVVTNKNTIAFLFKRKKNGKHRNDFIEYCAFRR